MRIESSPFVIVHDQPRECHGVPGSLLYQLQELETQLIADIQAPPLDLAAWENVVLRQKGEMDCDLSELEELVIRDLAKDVQAPSRARTRFCQRLAGYVGSVSLAFHKLEPKHAW